MEQVFKYSGKISFGLLLFLTVAIGMATVFEKIYGTAAAHAFFYGSPWFMAAWGTLAMYSILYLIAQKTYKNIPVFCLHIALFLILTGALITRFTAQNGSIHLRQNKPNHFFSDEDRGTASLPFTVELTSFQISYYLGTQSPANYISQVTINDPSCGEETKAEISMNNILSYKGYRFYQASFDDDLHGSILRINRDTYGIPVTYAGYYFLFFFMSLLLISKHSRFRTLLRSPILKKNTFILLLTLVLHSTVSATPASKLPSISTEQSKPFETLWMLYNGRLAPVHTFAHDFCLKLTGKTNYKSYSATQVLSGFLFFGKEWNLQNFFEIENQELKIIIGKKHACVSDFFIYHKNVQHYILAPYLSEAYTTGIQSPFLKEIAKLDEKIQIITMLQNGYLLDIFPVKTNGRIEWLSTNDSLLLNSDFKNYLFYINTAIHSGNTSDYNEALNILRENQITIAADILPHPDKLRAERFYNNSHIFSWLFKFALTFGLIGLIAFTYNIFSTKPIKTNRTLGILLLALFISLTLGLILRTYISGRLPLGNGFETMLFTAWCTMGVALLLRRYSSLIPTFGLLLSGFILLVAHLGSMNPKITHLVPVLSSPLLSIHVSVIMFSYALAGFMAFNSIISFILLAFGSTKSNERVKPIIDKLHLISEIFLYPCAFFLAAGIFIGAIWANVSWGRYWGWDPKEGWALVTLLLAILPFHKKSLPIFRQAFFFNAHILIVFMSILMTYFGVNYFLGGMHSYADTTDSNMTIAILLSITVCLIALIIIAYFRMKRVAVKK